MLCVCKVGIDLLYFFIESYSVGSLDLKFYVILNK